MKMTVQSPAKLNLFLEINGKRNDGYHLISTVMQSVTLYDDITVTVDKEGHGIELSCNKENIPCDSSNTAYKAAEVFFEHTGLPKAAVSIRIKKRIPSGAGMAGGSTDAAGVLYALNELYETDMTNEELAGLGERIGADVPFCVYGGTMSATGIGSILSPLPDMPDCHIVIVMPDFRISTAEAYNRSDSLGYDFTKSMENMTGAICSERLAQTAAALYNRFEDVAGIDEISEIKEMMLRSGALGALMTGSGSAVFGIFDDRDKASSCEDNLSRKYDEVFIVHPDRAGPQKVVPGGLIGSLLG